MSREDLGGRHPKGSQYEELRRLLVQPERREIEAIRSRVEDPKKRAKDVASVLPEAVRASATEGDDLGRALSPTLEGAIRTSIRKDPRTFADLLFPVMGPAIRRSIAHALKDLIQNLNQALEHSFSLRGLRWRLEAVRTGKSFGEVVLAHTLVYRVEELFLIHRETGLVLGHLADPDVRTRDAGLVSGMLTAIQDFVKESFDVDGQETLHTMEVGGLDVWVDQGPGAVLAAVIRGEAPQSLHGLLRETLEEIHARFSEELEAFEGDASPFQPAEGLMEPCLRAQQEAPGRRVSPLLVLLPVLAAVLLCWWGIREWSGARRARLITEALAGEPGIELLKTQRRGGTIHLRGLRDPFSSDPDSVLRGRGFDSENVRYEWREYLSLDGPVVLRRARRILGAPPMVRLEYAGGVLTASGAAEAGWILRARDLALLVPGVTRYEDGGLSSGDEALFDASKAEIEGARLFFSGTTAALEEGQEPVLEDLSLAIRHLFQAAESLGVGVRVLAVGHTDPSGSEETNESLSLERARSVRRALVARGTPEERIGVSGMGSSRPSEGVDPGVEPHRLRRVTFRIVEPSGGGDGA